MNSFTHFRKTFVRVVGFLSLALVMLPGAAAAGPNDQRPFTDTVETFVTTTPSNLLAAWENQAAVGGQPTHAEAHLSLTGVSKTTPSFTMTARAHFLKNAWTLTDIHVAGTIPWGSVRPELFAEDIKFNPEYKDFHPVLIKITSGTPYAMTWTISGTASDTVRPVLLPRFLPHPWVGPKRGWVVKLRDYAPAGGFDPYVAPFGPNNENLKKLLDPIVASSKNQSNGQVELTYDIKEIYYDGPYQMNESRVEEAALSTLGINAANVGDFFEWAPFTVYPQTISSKKPTINPGGAKPYDRRGNWYPDITYRGPGALGVFFHELNHTHGWGQHPHALWGCGTSWEGYDVMVINPLTCTQGGEVAFSESMGGMINTLWLHPIHRASLGWLKGPQVKLASQTGSYELYSDRPDFTSDPARPLLLQIPAAHSDTGEYFYVTLPNIDNLKQDPQVDVEYLSKGAEVSAPTSTASGPSQLHMAWLAYSYNDNPFKRTISPGRELRLLNSTTDIRIRNLDRVGDHALVSIRFDNEPLPYDAPVLLAPSNLEAKEVNGVIALKWKDNSGMEAGYSVERRTERQTQFQEIGRTAANHTEMTDADPQPGTTSYRVRALAKAGASAYSDPAIVRVANQPPRFHHLPAGSYTITAGQSLRFAVAATDPERQPITLTATANGYPLDRLGATFTDHRNGTGIFAWTPSSRHGGTTSLITVKATDAQRMSAQHVVTVAVTHPALRPGEPEITAMYWRLLGRAPDPGGLQYWMMLYRWGISLRTIEQWIYWSPESQNRMRKR